MTDYYEYAIPQLVKLLGARFKDYRLRSNMTQKEVSEQSGLTTTTSTSLRAAPRTTSRSPRFSCC